MKQYKTKCDICGGEMTYIVNRNGYAYCQQCIPKILKRYSSMVQAQFEEDCKKAKIKPMASRTCSFR